eukprot:TRINITY_DN1520_c0_g1_i2.p1 TRINITY_DN1520_c0_g1~~TRINITY_DN1520_c0_g1_i2.p1  ORF type:complete len:108 (+),score=9.74 TRINITY_DN1520_c0_g1_i2:109-432(+)
MNVDQGIWIFGYGSLVWRPDFPYTDKLPSYIKGWKRRFWQGSTDHRGIPEAPGRVVTLIEKENAITWGIAYRVAPENRDKESYLLYLREAILKGLSTYLYHTLMLSQ